MSLEHQGDDEVWAVLAGKDHAPSLGQFAHNKAEGAIQTAEISNSMGEAVGRTAVLDFTSQTVCTQNLEAGWSDKLGETGRYIYSLKREPKEPISKVLFFFLALAITKFYRVINFYKMQARIDVCKSSA